MGIDTPFTHKVSGARARKCPRARLEVVIPPSLFAKCRARPPQSKQSRCHHLLGVSPLKPLCRCAPPPQKFCTVRYGNRRETSVQSPNCRRRITVSDDTLKGVRLLSLLAIRNVVLPLGHTRPAQNFCGGCLSLAQSKCLFSYR